MSLTNENLVEERPHPIGLGGVQRIYRFKNGWELSLVNTPMLHHYPFAWEAAVMDSSGLRYDTPLTSDVEVFDSDEEANAFIKKAQNYFENLSLQDGMNKGKD